MKKEGKKIAVLWNDAPKLQLINIRAKPTNDKTKKNYFLM